MKKLLYALLGLWLFGVQSVSAQESSVLIQAKKGLVAPINQTQFPSKTGFASPLWPATIGTTTAFYYDTKDGRVFVSFGAGGVTYVPGVGLSLSNNTLSVVQNTQGSLGSVMLDNQFWNPASMIPTVNAEAMDLQSGYFLGMLGTQTVRTPFATLKTHLAQSFGVGSGGGGSGSGIEWVFPPASHNAPGKIGQKSYYAGYIFEYGRKIDGTTQWFRQSGVDTVFTTNFTNPGSVPLLTSSYNAGQNTLLNSWIYTGTDVVSWDVFFSPNDSLHFQFLKGDIAAGERSYNFANTGGVSRFYITVRGKKANGNLTPFSNKTEVIIPAQSGYQPVTNVVINPRNGNNAFDFFFNTPDAGGIATLYISTNVNANAASADGWTKVSDLTINNAGSYSIPVPNINDTQARVFKIQRSGGSLSPSAFQKFGPASLSSVSTPLNAPTLTGQAGQGNSVNLAYNTNNSNVTSATIQRSADGGSTWPKSISVPALNGAGSAVDNDVTSGNTYLYRMFITKDGQNSPFSSTVSVTIGTSTAIAVPYFDRTRGAGLPGATSVFYFWRSNGAAITGYNVDQRTETGAWERIIENRSPETPIYEPDVRQANSAYGRSVRYQNLTAQGTSVWSEVLSFRESGNFFSPADQTPTGQVPPTAQPLQASLVSQTSSAITISFANASSNRSYNASIYRGDPSTPNSFVDGWFNLQSTGGQLTLDISRTSLTPGVAYRIYPAEYNGEPALQKQSRGGNYVEFVRTTGNGTGPSNRVLIIGNSITNHGDAPQLGWNTNGDSWGMAASAKNKDWAHLAESYIKGLNASSTVQIAGANGFETDYGTGFNYTYFEQLSYNKDLVIIQLGDNVNDGDAYNRNLPMYYDRLIDALRVGNPNMKIILTTAYWQRLNAHPNYDAIVKDVASYKTVTGSRIIVADLAGLDTYENSANTQLPSAAQAVKDHPGDKGHAAIANKVFSAYQFINAIEENPNPTPGVGRPVTVTYDRNFQNLGETYLISTSQLTIGVSKLFGGALNYMKQGQANQVTIPGADNIINNYDHGRQVQQSVYQGPVNFVPAGFEKNGNWSSFPYNVVQGGDSYNNIPRIDAFELPTAANNWTLYVKAFSYNWSLNGYNGGNADGQGDHYLESWYQFIDDDFVKVRYKITFRRQDGFNADNVPGANERSEMPAMFLERPYQHWWGNPVTDSPGLGPTLFNGYRDPNFGEKFIPTNTGIGNNQLQSYPIKDYWVAANKTTSPDDKGFGIVLMDAPTEPPCHCYTFAGFNYYLNPSDYVYQNFSLSYANFSGPALKLYGNGTMEYTFGTGNLSPNETKAKYQRWGQAHGTGR